MLPDDGVILRPLRPFAQQFPTLIKRSLLGVFIVWLRCSDRQRLQGAEIQRENLLLQSVHRAGAGELPRAAGEGLRALGKRGRVRRSDRDDGEHHPGVRAYTS